MRPTEFSDEDIIKAGQELQEAGINVTGFALRKAIGGGNPSRLARVWHSHLAESVPLPSAAELPTEVHEGVRKLSEDIGQRLLQVAAGLNEAAVKAATRRVDAIQAECDGRQAQASQELEDASTAVEALEAELSEMRAELTRVREQMDQANERTQVHALDVARLQEQLASERAKGRELATELSEVKASAADARQLQGTIEALQQQNQALLQRLTVTAAPNG